MGENVFDPLPLKNNYVNYVNYHYQPITYIIAIISAVTTLKPDPIILT